MAKPTFKQIKTATYKVDFVSHRNEAYTNSRTLIMPTAHAGDKSKAVSIAFGLKYEGEHGDTCKITLVGE